MGSTHSHLSSLWNRWPPRKAVRTEHNDTKKENLHSSKEKPQSDRPAGPATGRRIFAYIICINEYEAKQVPNLHACVQDGKKFEYFLTAKFRDQILQIERLYDNDATYDKILSLFETALTDPSIQKGDLVIFFYAGHGSRTPAPKGWSTEDGLVETICPHDVDTKTKDGKNIYGIPDFVIGTVMRNLAITREANVLLVFDSCYSAGMARDKTEYLTPRYAASNPIPEYFLNDLLSKYPEKRSLYGQTLENSTSPFTLLAACGKHETAHEKRSLEESWEGAFTDALVTLLKRVPWYNLSYATLCKSLPKLPYQKPECVGESDRIVFALDRAEEDGLYFDIEPAGDGIYSVKDAGLTLGIGIGTKFKIRGPEAQDFGTLIVDSLEASQCRARAELADNYKGSIPEEAKAFLHHWSLGDGPLRVALEGGIERPDTAASVQITDQPSDADIVIAKRGDYLEIDRQQDSYIASTTNVRTLQLPKHTDKVALETILTKIARFHHHLLRGGPGNVRDNITMELCRVRQGTDGRHHTYTEGPESSAHVMSDTVDLQFRSDARYGMVIKNNSTHALYSYLFYFDPSDYSIHAVYPPQHQRSEQLVPDGVLHLGYGSSSVRPLRFYLKADEEFDVGFLRLFVSTSPLPMENLKQGPISQSARHMAHEPEIEETDVWDVRTIVLRVDRNTPTVDMVTQFT